MCLHNISIQIFQVPIYNLRNFNKNLPSQSLNIISDVNAFHNMSVQELSGGDVTEANATNPA